MPLCLRSPSPSSACRGLVQRQYHNLRNAPPRRFPRLGSKVALGVGVGATTTFVFSISRLESTDVCAYTSDDLNLEHSNIQNTPLSSLLRSYLVFTLCSVPAFVDWSPRVISFMTSIPGLRQLAAAFVRRSFFAQVRMRLLFITSDS
jgi:proline dehydrogenase